MNISKVKFYLSLANQVATQATCPRASVGAVLVNDDRVVSIGYNGAVRGSPHCRKEGCWLQPKEDRQTCLRAVHAEANALINAAYGGSSTKNAFLFCTHKPCINCAKLLINAGIKFVFYVHNYPDKLVAQLLVQPLLVMTQVSYPKNKLSL